MEAIVTSSERRQVAADVREVAWRVLTGAAAGALAGALVGGIGGRLAMLLLRLTSPDALLGSVSDDGFVIGGFSSFATLNLILGTAAFGAANGVLYVALRGLLPRLVRVALWTAFGAAAGGATFVHEDGLDFTLLEPAWLAVGLFVALPAAAALVVAVLVERWSSLPPWRSRRTTVLLAAAALLGTFALAVAAVAVAALVAVRRLPLARLRLAATVAVTALVAAVTVLQAVILVGEASRLI